MDKLEFFRTSTRLSDYFDHYVAFKTTGLKYLVYNPLAQPYCPYQPLEKLGDDPGIYQIFTKLSIFTGIENELFLHDLLFFSICLLSLLISVFSFFLLTKDNKCRIAMFILNLFFFLYALAVFDLYTISYFSIALIPLALIVILKNKNFYSICLAFLFFSYLQGISESIRSFTGIASLAFVLIFYLIIKSRLKYNGIKTYLPMIFCLAFFIPTYQQTIDIKQRNIWLNKNYDKCIKDENLGQKRVFWHIMYLGLYANKKLNIEYRDDFAFSKTGNHTSNRFSSYSTSYNKRIKEIYLNTVKNNLLEVIVNYYQKLIESIFPSVLFIFFGLILSIKTNIFSKGLLFYWLFNLLPPIVAMPISNYKISSLYLSILFFSYQLIMNTRKTTSEEIL